jgi:uncharacterized membrane protein YhaH (DUF805 family)
MINFIVILWKAYFSCWKRDNYANFRGRAKRTDYWGFWLFDIIITVVLAILDDVAGTPIKFNIYDSFDSIGSIPFLYDIDDGYDKIGIMSLLYGIASFIPYLAVCVRRMHDIGKSGWNLLPLLLLPVIGWIILLIWLCEKSAKEEFEKYEKNLVVFVLGAIALIFYVIIIALFIWVFGLIFDANEKRGSSHNSLSTYEKSLGQRLSEYDEMWEELLSEKLGMQSDSDTVFNLTGKDTIYHSDGKILEVIDIKGEVFFPCDCNNEFYNELHNEDKDYDPVVCKYDRDGGGCIISQDVSYPQISGLSDAKFQREINSVMKDYSFVEQYWGEGSTRFNILQNDGEILAVQLINSGEGGPCCSSTNAYGTSDIMITIDVLRNKEIPPVFSSGGNRIYSPFGALKMSVLEINRLIRNYYEENECCGASAGWCDSNSHIIEKISGDQIVMPDSSSWQGKNLFVISDGYVAIEQPIICGPRVCSGGGHNINVIPLYKLED